MSPTYDLAVARAAGERFERLSTADASNIAIDAPDQVNAFLMAGVLAPGGPVAADGSVDIDALRSALAERVPRAKRLGQRVRREGRSLVWEPVALGSRRKAWRTPPSSEDGSGVVGRLGAELNEGLSSDVSDGDGGSGVGGRL